MLCFSHNQTSNKSIDGIPRYVFCIFKNGVLGEHTAETNYQLCPHANIQSITVHLLVIIILLEMLMQILIIISLSFSIKNF